ncbi:MAG: hypothetical protein Q8L20_10910 [Gammaproteobacteria bacterium]|nr:hypothetical protein [Gammaproteobacteria bacterium]
MTPSESRNYELGREARRFNYGRNACNLRGSGQRVARSWWMAGWHDEDMNIETLMRAGIAA